jgi:hypothetical protein
MFFPLDPVTGQPAEVSFSDVVTVWKAARGWMSRRRGCQARAAVTPVERLAASGTGFPPPSVDSLTS